MPLIDPAGALPGQDIQQILARLPAPLQQMLMGAARGGSEPSGMGEGVVPGMLQAPQVTEGTGTPGSPAGAPGGWAGLPPGQQNVIPAMLGPFGQPMPSAPSLVDRNFAAMQTPYGLMPLSGPPQPRTPVPGSVVG